MIVLSLLFPLAAASEATFTVPSEIVLALALLPGYVFIRTLLYSAKYSSPADWPEYEKTAVSLLGGIPIILVLTIVFERWLPLPLDVDANKEGNLIITSNPELLPDWFLVLLILAVIGGLLLGRAFTVYYTGTTGLTRRLTEPMKFLLEQVERPIPVRVITSEREIVGRVRYADADSNIAIISDPWLVVKEGEENSTHREKMGRHAHINTEKIEDVYIGSDFKSREEGSRQRRLVNMINPWSRNENNGSHISRWDPDKRIKEKKKTLKREPGKVLAQGVLKNIDPQYLAFVQVRVLFKNVNGEILDTGYDSIEWLPQNEKWEYNVEYETDDPKGVRTVLVRKYADYV